MAPLSCCAPSVGCQTGYSDFVPSAGHCLGSGLSSEPAPCPTACWESQTSPTGILCHVGGATVMERTSPATGPVVGCARGLLQLRRVGKASPRRGDLGTDRAGHARAWGKAPRPRRPSAGAACAFQKRTEGWCGWSPPRERRRRGGAHGPRGCGKGMWRASQDWRVTGTGLGL